MRCDKLIEQLEQFAPRSYACDWDNPGLLAGSSRKEIHKVLIALDVTDAVLKQAVTEQVDLLLTHHPLIFTPLKQVNDLDFIGRRMLTLVQHDIAYYAMHTNFDVAPGGMADLAAERMGLEETGILEKTGEVKAVPYGIGKIGCLKAPMSLKALAQKVKTDFELPFITVYGSGQMKESVSRIAISPGSGKGMAGVALQCGAQVLITGDIGHHEGIDAVANGLVILDAGHYGLEHIFIDFMESYLPEQVDDRLLVIKAALEFPAVVW
ncbi:MAG: Nif3-like dinuclear metal center hexameric protein [Hungatella sp.]